MNPVADALSRIIIGNVQPGINYQQMAEQQETDTETKVYRDFVTNLQWAEVDISGDSILCDTSTGRPRPLVLRDSKRAVVDIIHSLSHPSIQSTIKLVRKSLCGTRWQLTSRNGLKYVCSARHVTFRDTRRPPWTTFQCQHAASATYTLTSLDYFLHPTRCIICSLSLAG